MNEREMRAKQQELQDSGAEKRVTLSKLFRSQAEAEIARRREEKDANSGYFKAFVGNWTPKASRLDRLGDEAQGAETGVHGDHEDKNTARVFFAGAIIAMAGELGLGSWAFHNQNVFWGIGAIAAFIMTAVLHGVFQYHYEVNSTDSPRAVVTRLKKGPGRLFGIAFVVAAVVAAYSRYVEGEAAYALLSWFSIFLTISTISLMGIAAILFCLARLFGTTGRYERIDRQLDDQINTAQAFLDWLAGRESRAAGSSPANPTMPPSTPPPTPSGISGGGNGNRMEPDKPVTVKVDDIIKTELPSVLKTLALVVGMSALAANSWSQSFEKSTPSLVGSSIPTAESQIAGDKIPCEISTVIDITDSPLKMRAGITCLKEEALAPLVEWTGCSIVKCYTFSADGWAMDLVRTDSMPLWEYSVPSSDNDMLRLKNFKDAWDRENSRHRDSALSQYRQKVQTAINSFAVEQYLPDSTVRSNASDVVGVLRACSDLRSEKRLIVLILTDLADTHYRCTPWPAIPPPTSNVSVIVLVFPSSEHDAVLTLGKAASAAEQYAARSRLVRSAAPWAIVVPYCTTDLCQLISRPAMTASASQNRNPQ